jgi:hypothetical protein
LGARLKALAKTLRRPYKQLAAGVREILEGLGYKTGDIDKLTASGLVECYPGVTSRLKSLLAPLAKTAG